MTITIKDNIVINVLIEKKIRTKNLYMRMKDSSTLKVTCNTFTPDFEIKNFINSHIKEIEKMYSFVKKKEDYDNTFMYLGDTYNVVYTDTKQIMVSNGNIYFPNGYDINKFYTHEAKRIFKKHLDNCYNNFTRRIPEPSLRIRKMKTRWGVCNTKTHVITLNLELIKKDTKYLDYVIIHELSHLLEGNHSSRFWSVVEENYPDYKKMRKELKNYE